MKKQLTVTIDEKIYNDIDKLAKKVGLNRSQMVENLLGVALMDVRILKFVGLIDLAVAVMNLQEKVSKRELRVSRVY